MERKFKRIEVLDIHVRSMHVDTLRDFLALVQSAYDAVPEEHKATCAIEGDYDSYDPGPGWITAWYERPETDAEITERERADSEYLTRYEAHQRAEYERLKAKFEVSE